MNLANLLPAFPHKSFSEEDAEKFISSVVKSELEELSKVREVLKPFLRKIPRELKTVSQRVDYLVSKP